MSNSISPETCRCLWVTATDKSDTINPSKRQIHTRQLGRLENDHVRVQVEYSSLNYKDALCASGHPGIAKTLPIIPGIDAAGTIVESKSERFAAGDQVMIFHAKFGTEVDGGFCQYVDVAEDWVYAVPSPLTTRQAMILGTAGFTAAQCIDELINHSITPDRGEIVVTGATGGVGICAVRLLAHLGYDVIAASGKPDRYPWLKQWGASEVVDRQTVQDSSQRPLLQGRWAGAVDTVGGHTLATILRSTQPRGCVTACGLVGGVDLSLTVYPFILRGVTLQGIDTAYISPQYRKSLWHRLATDWLLDDWEALAIEVDLDGLEDKITQILAGGVAGRVIVRLAS